MWNKHLKIANSLYLDRQMQYAWELRERAAGRPVIGMCKVDPSGWILYDLGLKVETEPFASSHWELSFHLALIEGERLIQVYTMSSEEWFDFPTLPQGWDIPF